MAELTGSTRIRLSQIIDQSGRCLDKHSPYKIGDRAKWKDGIHEKTSHGWKKVVEQDNTAGWDIKLNKNNLEKNRQKLINEVVSNARPDAIRGTTPKELRKNTRTWIRENIKEPISTEIGKISFFETAGDSIYHHGNARNFRNKADVVPCITDVMEKGVYIGHAPDFDGKATDNYYFAGKVKTKKGKELVFCRICDNAGDKDSPRFYFHDVFTLDDVIKQGAIPVKSPDKNQQLSGSPLFMKLIYNFLFVNGENQIKDKNIHSTLDGLFMLMRGA